MLVRRAALLKMLVVLVVGCIVMVILSAVSLVGYQGSDDVVEARKGSRRMVARPMIVPDSTSLPDLNVSGASEVFNEIPRLLFKNAVKSPLKWNYSLYLPLGKEALQGFLGHDDKQKLRVANNPSLKEIWSKELSVLGGKSDLSSCGRPDVEGAGASKASCSFEVPECDFWLHVRNLSSTSEAPLQRMKCCSEHLKLKKTLFYVLDLVDAYLKG